MRVVATRLALWCLICAACSDDPARVRLVPVRPVETGPCGTGAERPRPTELVVIAYARSREVLRTVPVDEAIAIDEFPGDTEQIGVEARRGGEPIAIGKTAPLAFTDLPEGATIPIFMAPPDGFCPVGPMRAARKAPLVARSGDGVLVVGGVDALGNALTTAERYDPATGTFTEVPVPSILGEGGFLGATLTSLPDGRVVLAGGPQRVATIYNPAKHAFGESVLIEARAFHAAVATEGNQFLLLGGCSAIDAGGCGGIARLGSKLYEATDADTVREIRPSTTLRAGRVGARVIDIGVQEDGKRAFVMAGGIPPPNTPAPAASDADVFTLDASDASLVRGSRYDAAALDGGAVLSAFASDTEPANGSAAVFPPGADARDVARAPDLDGARLVAHENGRVVAIGGTASGMPVEGVLRYDPSADLWERIDPDADAGSTFVSPVLHRLEDGSVLVIGDLGAAYIYRPPLLGPTSGAVRVVPIGPARANVLTAVDPTTVTRGADWTLSSGGAARARALVGGPRMENGTISVLARVKGGGIGIVAQQSGPGRALIAELVPGAAARLVLLANGAETTLCSGDAIAPFDPSVAATITLEIGEGRATLRREGDELLACDVTGEQGAWGVAAVGAGAAVAIDAVSLNR
jgi:hypothetical protein